MNTRLTLPLAPILLVFAQTQLFAQLADDAKYKREVSQVKQSLGSDDPARLDSACQTIRRMLDERRYPSDMRGSWIPMLAKRGRHREAAEFALLAFIATPDAKTALAMMTIRTNSLLALGQNAEALAAAKMAFNACSVTETEKAATLFAECVAHTHPDDPSASKRAKLELAGWPDSSTVSFLIATSIDPQPFQHEIERLTSAASFSDILHLTTLLLAANRGADAELLAKSLFDRETDPKQRALAGEALARAIRARDGNMTRANQFLQTLNQGGPKPATDQNLP